ncbi:MAG: hypothetical protein WBA35_09215 [Litorimonas sp.]
MTVQDFYDFVEASDVSKKKHDDFERLRIARYGLFSEVGSVIATLKKADLLDPSLENGNIGRSLLRGELREEIGDALWYVVMLAKVVRAIEGDPRADDIFSADIEKLQNELSGSRYEQKRIQARLGEAKVSDFLSAARNYLEGERTLDGYQTSAKETARTKGSDLREVCVAVLQQLTAQLAREMLPEVEHALNHEVYPKDTVDALGEIVWHLSALASLYEIDLSESVGVAMRKAEFRNLSEIDTPCHDFAFPEDERFPETMKFRFRDIGEGVSEVSWRIDGEWRPMGNELEDNHIEDDAYRFHDVMHLSFIVFLGWSPVFRKFMGLKRNTPVTGFDESVQDGGRAKVLEESLILQIHTHAERLRRHAEDAAAEYESSKLFSGSVYDFPGAIGFDFLKRLHDQTRTYEVQYNTQQDWESAIIQGYRMFAKLRESGGGIVIGDANARTLTFQELKGKASA